MVLLLFAFPFGAFSQEVKEYRNIGIDSLMVLMKGECSQRVFYVAGEDSRNMNFTIEVPKGKSLLGQIKEVLSGKGYSVIPFEGNLLGSPAGRLLCSKEGSKGKGNCKRLYRCYRKCPEYSHCWEQGLPDWKQAECQRGKGLS